MRSKLERLLIPGTALALISNLAIASEAGPDVTITAIKGECQSTESHAHASAFFGKNLRNVIATNNEYQEQGGNPVDRDTLLRLDVWSGNYDIVGYNGEPADVVSLPGTCLGHIEVFIPGGTNQGAQFALEDYLDTPDKGQGVIMRTGQLDQRSKFDIFIDIDKRWSRRQVIWNNFVGMPNPSGEMSSMRFERGQHFSCVNSGDIPGRLQFQVFDVDGTFMGVTEGCDSAPKSIHVTPDVTKLDYYDLNGNPVDVTSAIGRGIVKMTGVENADGVVSPYTSAVSIYQTTSSIWGSWNPYWLDNNGKLSQSTITYLRRNAGNDTLDLGE